MQTRETTGYQQIVAASLSSDRAAVDISDDTPMVPHAYKSNTSPWYLTVMFICYDRFTAKSRRKSLFILPYTRITHVCSTHDNTSNSQPMTFHLTSISRLITAFLKLFWRHSQFRKLELKNSLTQERIQCRPLIRRPVISIDRLYESRSTDPRWLVTAKHRRCAQNFKLFRPETRIFAENKLNAIWKPNPNGLLYEFAQFLWSEPSISPEKRRVPPLREFTPG